MEKYFLKNNKKEENELKKMVLNKYIKKAGKEGWMDNMKIKIETGSWKIMMPYMIAFHKPDNV